VTSAEVALLLDGTTRQIREEVANATILEAAERQGIAPPYSCRGGMCCTCRCRVSEDSVEMAANYSLET
jgi:ring-1,2-phenylacetyl-CoA epoxidase subunit PaaE